MEVSEARLAANRQNATRSTGPTSEQGKAISRRNSLKHGLTGEGIVLHEGDQAEVESRFQALRDELQPQSSLGSMLIRKIATFSVRSERASERENLVIAERARHAVEVFDELRALRVEDLMDAFHDNPSGVVRNLRRMPEGVDRLIDAWHVLRLDLDREGPHQWSSPQMARAANLSGIRSENVHRTRFGVLSTALWGDFHSLAPNEGGDLDDDGRRNWARVALIELIDAQIAELTAHKATLDLDRIEQDRREAPGRSAFDDSKSGEMARRYEAASDRSFYKALKEFRQVESEYPNRIEAAPALPNPDLADPEVGSSCETTPPPSRERGRTFRNPPMADNSPVAKGQHAPHETRSTPPTARPKHPERLRKR